MRHAEFWPLVERVRESSQGDEDKFQDEIFLRLANLSVEELREFDQARVLADRELGGVSVGGKDLHTIVYEVWGGCSDDSYMDFRSSVIANGRDYFEAIVADPVGTLSKTKPPTFSLRFEGAISYPMFQLEGEMGAPIWDEGDWDTPALARLLLAAWEADDEDALRASFARSLRDGPRWAWGLASRWLRQDLQRSLGPATEEPPEEAEEALSLIKSVPTDGRARRAKRNALKALRDATVVSNYAALKVLESRASDWLEVLEYAGSESARLVLRTLAATERGEARLRALRALEKHGDALGMSAALYRVSAADSVVARDDSVGVVTIVWTTKPKHDVLAVACNLVDGNDPYFPLLFEEATDEVRERAWRFAATWLVRIAEPKNPKAVDALKAGYADPKRRSHAGLCLALLGDDSGLNAVTEIVRAPCKDRRLRLSMLKAIILHGPQLHVEHSLLETWTLMQGFEVLAGKCALSDGDPALLTALKLQVPLAIQIVGDRTTQYAEGLITELECDHYLIGAWAVHRVLRKYAPDEAGQFEVSLRELATTELIGARIDAFLAK